jgi:hypothetical protein
MADDKGKIRIRVVIDENDAEVTKTWISEIAKQVEIAEKKTAQVVQEQIKQQNNLSASIKGSIEQYEFEDEKLNELLRTARQLGKDEQVYAILMKKGYVEGIAEIERMIGLRKQEGVLTKEQIAAVNRRATELRHESIAIRRVSADIQLFSQGAFISGTAITGTALAMAKKYADQVKNVTDTGQQFNKAQQSFNYATLRMGESFAKATVPVIKDATRLLDRAAKFMSEHPEAVSAALKVGEVLIGVGILGKGISVVTRLTADVLAIQSSIMRLIATRATEALVAKEQVVAANTMLTAAEKQLLAAAEMQGASTTGVAGGAAATATGAKVAGGITLAGAGLIAAATLTLAGMNFAIAKQLDKLEEMAPAKFKGTVSVILRWLEQAMAAVPGLQMVAMIRNMRRTVERDFPVILDIIDRIRGVKSSRRSSGATAGVSADVTDTFQGLAFNEHLDELLDAYEDYKRNDLEAVEDHHNRRLEITADGLARERAEIDRNLKNMENIREQESKALRDLQKNFDRQEADDLRQYQRRRSDILGESAEEQIQAAKDLANKLEKLWFDHAENVGTLLDERDAAGLVRENQRFQRALLEAQKEAAEEKAQRRDNIADKLADLDREYAEERARRLEDFQIRAAEIREDATEKREEERKRHLEELAEIRKQTQVKLQEEDRRFNEERRRAQLNFIQRIRDIDAALLGERNLQVQRRREMMMDLDRFLVDYRMKWSALQQILLKSGVLTGATGSVGTKAFGGYASFGLYKLGDNPTGGRGPEEFVMSGDTTRTAESIIGGRLNQQAILKAMLRGNRTSVTLNDHRRFDSRLSVADRRAIANDTMQLLGSLVN